MLAIPFPNIHPEIVSFGPFALGGWTLGPFAIRWYALAYIAGLIVGWRYCLALAKQPPQGVRPADVDDFLVWATLGVVLGGRIGYVVFYNLEHYLAQPLDALAVWHGGMSFHGGAIGVVLAILLFCRQRQIPLLGFADIIACATPIGLFFGRIANFINGELWGRASGAPWAMVFPADPEHLPRHPSQLYEAALEGVVLFLVLWVLQRFFAARRQQGFLTGVFLVGYGLVRIVIELFRQPDPQLGFLFRDQLGFDVTMGQLLSLPLVVVGIWLIRRKPTPPPA
jgi:phosphatidylglycerol---prolipoprotein diacylglyceryl transferase